MMSWQEIWHTEFLWNSVSNWSLAVVAFLVTFTVLPLVKGFISSRRKKWAQSQRELPLAIEVAAMLVDRTNKLFLFTVAIVFACAFLTFPARIENVVRIAIVLTFWF